MMASKEMDSLADARHRERLFKKWKKPERILAWFQRLV
jgi:hypothetical protein